MGKRSLAVVVVATWIFIGRERKSVAKSKKDIGGSLEKGNLISSSNHGGEVRVEVYQRR